MVPEKEPLNGCVCIIIIAVTSVGYELTQMNLNSQMNSVNVSYEFELTNFNKCNL